jgi:mRNA-degrading endonuclease RelE of RelBE toxin-antitoxin system
MSYRVEVSPQVQAFHAALGLTYRRALKRALLGLATERGDIKALAERLDGYHRLRVGPYRIIFRYAEGRVIRCEFAERRSLVYEVFERKMLDRLGGE